MYGFYIVMRIAVIDESTQLERNSLLWYNGMKDGCWSPDKENGYLWRDRERAHKVAGELGEKAVVIPGRKLSEYAMI